MHADSAIVHASASYLAPTHPPQLVLGIEYHLSHFTIFQLGLCILLFVYLALGHICSVTTMSSAKARRKRTTARISTQATSSVAPVTVRHGPTKFSEAIVKLRRDRMLELNSARNY